MPASGQPGEWTVAHAACLSDATPKPMMWFMADGAIIAVVRGMYKAQLTC